MMRPIVLNVVVLAPAAPTQTTAVTFTGNVNVTWTDPTPATMGDTQNEVGFIIERCARINDQACTNFVQIGKALANATSYVDTTATTNPYYSYRVIAYNAAGNSPASNVISTTTTAAINGVCGASDGGIFISAPTTEFCTAGTYGGTVNFASPTWSWTCNGLNAGASANCSANLQNYVLTYNPTANGSVVSGSTVQVVYHGANAATVTAAPTPNSAYKFVSWTNSLGAIVSVVPAFTATNVTANETYTASFAVPGDFNSDGNVDILWTDTNTNNSYVWYMNSKNMLAQVQLPAAPGAGWGIAAKGDFNNDGKTDLLWRNQTTGQNMIQYMNGIVQLPGTTAVNLPTILPPWTIAGVGDFGTSAANPVLDGKVDILLRNTSTGAHTIWFMNGATRTGSATLPTIGAPWTIVAVGDLGTNSTTPALDGKTDILLENPSTGAHTLWFMNGATRTGSVALPTIAPPWTIVGVGDFGTSNVNPASDGKQDILLRNPSTGANTIWYMNGFNRTGSSSLTPLIGANWKIVGK